MATVGRYINKDISYGGASDVRMNNGAPVVTPPSNVTPTTKYVSSRSRTGVENLDYCPAGSIYLGFVNGKPKCLAPTPRYRDVDKQAAYDKAEAEGITWTGQYTKDAVTGEVAPKPIEAVVAENADKAAAAAAEAAAAAAEAAALAKSVASPSGDFIKKNWWVLAIGAVGIYLISSKD